MSESTRGATCVQKLTLKITILTMDGNLGGLDLEDIVYRLTSSGEDLGSWEIESCEDVPPEAVRSECIKLGNDGEFFDNDLEELEEEANMHAKRAP